jgi:hypothetical protein
VPTNLYRYSAAPGYNKLKVDSLPEAIVTFTEESVTGAECFLLAWKEGSQNIF